MLQKELLSVAFFQQEIHFFCSGLSSSIWARRYSFQSQFSVSVNSLHKVCHVDRRERSHLIIDKDWRFSFWNPLCDFSIVEIDKNEIQLTKEKNPLKSASSACQYQQHFHIPYFKSHISPKKLLNKPNTFRMHNSFAAVFIITNRNL